MKAPRYYVLREGEGKARDYPCASAAEIAAYWRAHIAPHTEPCKESVAVVLLNTKMGAMGWHLVSVGTLAACYAVPTDVLRPVILAGAAGFVMLHNHPSGDLEPSSADRRATRYVAEGARIFQLSFSDHVIVSHENDEYYSMRENGLCFD